MGFNDGNEKINAYQDNLSKIFSSFMAQSIKIADLQIIFDELAILCDQILEDNVNYDEQFCTNVRDRMTAELLMFKDIKTKYEEMREQAIAM